MILFLSDIREVHQSVLVVFESSVAQSIVAFAMAATTASFLNLEGAHVFVTGAAGGVGIAVVREFLGRISGALQLRR